MKKKSAGLLFLCLCLLAGCAGSPRDTQTTAPEPQPSAPAPYVKPAIVMPEPITAQLQAELEQAWQEAYHTEPSWQLPQEDGQGLRYYGTYAGLPVIYGRDPNTTGLGNGYTLRVGAEVFTEDSPFVLLVYREGAFLSLEEAHTNGYLSAEAVAQCAGIHWRYRELKAQRLWASQTDGTPLWYEADPAKGIRFYGMIGTWYPVFFVPEADGSLEMQAGELCFSSSVPFRMYVCMDRPVPMAEFLQTESFGQAELQALYAMHLSFEGPDPGQQ